MSLPYSNLGNDAGYSQVLYDPDLTPKPLRIAKRGYLKSFTPVNTNSLHSTSSTDRIAVPARSSSVHSVRAKPGSLRQDTGCESLIESIQEKQCRLCKRHQRNPMSTAAITDQGVSQAPAPSGAQQRVYHNEEHVKRELLERQRSAEISARHAARSTGARAVTLGALKTADVQNHMDSGILPPSRPVTQRRVVTDAPLTHKDIKASKHDIRHVLRERPSFRKGFITRMVNNLAHKSRAKPVAPINHSLSISDSFDKILDTSDQKPEPKPEPKSEPVLLPERFSGSSGVTDGSNDNVFTGAIAAFPTPPTSNETSPRTSQNSEPAQPGTYPSRSLRIPEPSTMAGAELRLSAETDEIDLENGNGILVAIDIEGSLGPNPYNQDLWSQHVGLDVIVIIDNSLYTSPSMLMASCETTRALASMLNVVTDRLGILCTSPINDHRTLDADFTKVWPLTFIRERKLKTVLDAIVTTKANPTKSSWEKTITTATEALLQSQVPDPDTEILQDTFGHVILMTNCAKGLPAGILTHNQLQFHVVCPAGVPLGDFDAIECNGWKLRSQCMNEPQLTKPLVSLRNADPKSLISKLRNLVVHARSGKDVGKMTYLSLDIKAGPDCIIQDVMGKSEYLVLHPGELRTVLVRLKVRPTKARANALAGSTTLPELGPNSAAILRELDKMLKIGPRPSTVLTARLKYKHSLLPRGTTCSVMADCKIRRKAPNSHLEEAHEANIARKPDEGLGLIHNRLAYHLATCDSPKIAFASFVAEFGEEGWRSQCPDYTHLVFQEVKYQARLEDRLQIEASPRKPVLPQKMDMCLSPKSYLDLADNESLHNDENHRPESWQTNLSGGEILSSIDGQQALSDERLTEKTTRSLEALSADWSDVQSMSKASDTRRSASLKCTGKRQKGHQWLGGVRHQRSGSHPEVLTRKTSVGALALRSIASAGNSVSKGLGAI